SSFQRQKGGIWGEIYFIDISAASWGSLSQHLAHIVGHHILHIGSLGQSGRLGDWEHNQIEGNGISPDRVDAVVSRRHSLARTNKIAAKSSKAAVLGGRLEDGFVGVDKLAVVRGDVVSGDDAAANKAVEVGSIVVEEGGVHFIEAVVRGGG